MIPPEKIAAVSQALQEAFAVRDFESIEQMTRGLSPDLVFRIVVKGTPYLLRTITRINEQTNPARHFRAMKIAAEGGVAPRVRYASVEDGVSITDFVEPVPLSVAEARVRVPRLLRRLHALAPFPNAFNYVMAHKGFIWRLRKAGLLPADAVEEVFSRYERVCAVYPRMDADMVSSHSDLKPENILFDGERVWLVDWQAAFVNDRYFDLSVVANFIVTNDEEESAFLREYFGQAADEDQRARFFLMRQVVHMFYAAVFLMLGSGGKPVDLSGNVPSFREFHERIWGGEISLAGNEMRIVYARVHWAQLPENMQSPRFEEALRIVTERHAGQEKPTRLLQPGA